MKIYRKHPQPSDFPHVMYTPPGASADALGDITVIQHAGKTLLYSWLRSRADWPRRGGSAAIYYGLPPPKEVEWDAKNNPTLKTFSGWKRWHRGPPLIPSEGLHALETIRTRYPRQPDPARVALQILKAIQNATP